MNLCKAKNAASIHCHVGEVTLIPNQRILNFRIRRFRGCGNCPQVTRDCQHSLSHTRLWLRHTGNERWDNWGHIVAVFRPGEMVEVEITHDASTIYCASAASTIYPGVSDYINLANFSET
jgi:hypothetical protein